MLLPSKRIVFSVMKIACCASILCLTLNSSAIAAKKFTDEDLQKFIQQHGSFSKSSHAVMIEERARLNALQNAFLVADTYTLTEESKRLSEAMSRVVSQYEPSAGKESAAAWQITAAIVSESHQMREGISKNDYNKAYTHFSRVTGYCIRCHEAVRSWGKLPESITADEEKSLSDGAAKKVPSKSKVKSSG